jgi:hypothetical protein
MSKEQATVNRYAHVLEDGTVWGVSLWDGVSEYTPPDGHTLHPLDDDSPVGPGWSFKDGEFVDERPPADDLEV